MIIVADVTWTVSFTAIGKPATVNNETQTTRQQQQQQQTAIGA